MMKNKTKSTRKMRIWPLELLIGILLIGGTFFFAAKKDMWEAEAHLSSTVNYIKEQCNRYTRIELASETKSLMRIIQSTQQLQNKIYYERQMSPSFEVNESFLKRCARDSYVSGVVILDARGDVKLNYQADDFASAEVREYLDTEVLLSTEDIPEKKYSARIPC